MPQHAKHHINMSTPSIADLIADKSKRALSLFETASVDAVSGMLSKKSGRTYIHCQVRKNDVTPACPVGKRCRYGGTPLSTHSTPQDLR